MANFCKNCGSKLNPGAKFCNNCGQSVSHDTGNIGNTGSTGPSDFSGRSAYPDSKNSGNRSSSGKKLSIHDLLNIVLAGVLFVEIILVCFWQPGFVIPKKQLPITESETETVEAHEDITVVADSMRSNTLKLEKIGVSFGDNETGKAALLDDILEIESPNVSGGKIYNLAVNSWPSEPVTVAMDAPAPGEDEGYLIPVGIPAADANGNETVVWCPVKAEWSDGKAVAALNLTDVAGNVENINFYGLGDLGGDLVDRTKDWGYRILTFDATVGLDILSDGMGNIYAICVGEPELNKDCLSTHFNLHVPKDKYDDTNSVNEKIRKSDIKKYLKDMEEIYDYFAANYDVSPRTYWPMDVYFDKIGDSAAYFSMPKQSLGGRFGTKPIDGSYMMINIEDIMYYGYKRKGPPYIREDVRLYSSFAHELFHFVQRCYVSNGGTELWFDESSAAYYDAWFSQKIGSLKLDENYNKYWFHQFDVLPTSIYERKGNFTAGVPILGDIYEYVIGDGNVVYARLPVFSYLMQKDSRYLKLAYEYMKDKGGYKDDVVSYAAGTVMAPLVRGYFKNLVTLGKLYAKNNTPWEIYEGVIGNKEVDTAAWKALRYTEILKDMEQTDEDQKNSGLEGKYTLSPYSARFVILDTSELPDKEVSLKVSLGTPAVDGTLYKIEGDSYDMVTYNEIPSEKETSMAVKKGDKLLLMLVNERNSNCYGKVTYSLENDISPFLGQYALSTDDNIRMIIKENYMRLPNNGVNQLFFDSYDIDGNTLTIHFRNTSLHDYKITLLGNDSILWESTTGYKQEWKRVPKGQEYEEWGEIYNHH